MWTVEKTNQGAGYQSKILGYTNRKTNEHVLMTLALSQCVVENFDSK
jgi:S-adenosylmethionine synthetase